MDDVVIVGGGPAGTLAATILARAGARVRLFDRARFPRDKLCGDTLNPGALAVLRTYVPIDDILERGHVLRGMRLTGPGGVHVDGRWPAALPGRSIARRDLDAFLVDRASLAGARIEDGVRVTTAVVCATRGAAIGVSVAGPRGTTCGHSARLVIAADGRPSGLARGLGLARHPARPRRWAVGAYFAGVDDLGEAGEMHVRHGHYIGVAPLPGALTNVCLVATGEPRGRWRDPAAALTEAISGDAMLRERFARARRLTPPRVLGPMAMDPLGAGVPGLLVAGDAAGFIDPMTGDGLRFAFEGGALAAAVALDVLGGRTTPQAAPLVLADRRRAAFAAKWRFNRAVRRLVASPWAITAAALAARVVPVAFEAMIRYAGDCDVPRLARRTSHPA